MLGPLRVVRGGESQALGPPRQRALLAALLLDANRSVPVAVLLDRLWGDEPPDTAVKSIQKYVSNLRAILGVDRIVSDGGYRLVVGGGELDEVTFSDTLTEASANGPPGERLARVDRALAEWRGEPYADLADLAFLEPSRQRLGETRLALEEERLATLLELGEPGEVVAVTGELVEAQPFRERLWQLRMMALARTGRQADALGEYRRLRTILGEQLGLEPSAETAALEERILLQDPEVTAPIEDMPGNLPAAWSTIVARDAELERMRERLGGTRLLTVVGTAGVGKTTLAVELGRRVASEYPQGVWLVTLGPITDPERVASRVAEVLGVGDVPNHRPADALAEFLARRRTLLVLDNCEHVIDAAAALAAEIVRAAPAVTVVATSRSPLGVSGEHVFYLDTLVCPPPGVVSGEALHYPAVRLLVARAAEAGARLGTIEDVAGDLAEVTRLLDGIPLALELAAARLRVFAPVDVRRQLAGRLDLGSDRRDVPDRQRTLEAAIDWSFQLLSPEERRMLLALSVFRGGFTLEAVEAVCGEDGVDTPTVLSGLVDRSLVLVLPRTGSSNRYTMLWVIRRFAEERLGDAAAEARRRHADYYRRLGVEEGVWQARVAPHRLNEVAADYENLRVALAHHLEAGDLVEGLRLATAFANYAGQSGILVEGQTWLERFLAAAPDAPAELRVHALLSLSLAYNPVSSDASLRSAHAAVAESRTTTDRALIAEALCTTGRMHAVRMEREPALAAIEEALPIFEELGDRWGVAQCHEALGVVRRGSADDLAHYRRAVELYREVGSEHDLATTLFSMSFRSLLPNGLFDEARRALDESLARARGLGSRHVALHALTGLGQLARLEGDLDGATPMLEEALAGVRDAGDRRCTVRMLTALARIDLVRGESDRAWSGLHEAVAVAQQIDEGLSADTHETVDALGLLAMSVGEAELAARWLGAAEAIRSDHELLRPPPDQEAVDEAYRRLADRLGEERLTVLTEEGSRLSFAVFAAEVAASSLTGSG